MLPQTGVSSISKFSILFNGIMQQGSEEDSDVRCLRTACCLNHAGAPTETSTPCPYLELLLLLPAFFSFSETKSDL